MKSMFMVAMMAVAAFAFMGCKKEETLGDKMDKAVKSADKAVQSKEVAKDAEKAKDAAVKDADKAAGDLQKKLDGALQK